MKMPNFMDEIAELDGPPERNKRGRQPKFVSVAERARRVEEAVREAQEAAEALEKEKLDYAEFYRKARNSALYCLGGAVIAGIEDTASRPVLLPIVRGILSRAEMRDIHREGISILDPDLLSSEPVMHHEIRIVRDDSEPAQSAASAFSNENTLVVEPANQATLEYAVMAIETGDPVGTLLMALAQGADFTASDAQNVVNLMRKLVPPLPKAAS